MPLTLPGLKRIGSIQLASAAVTTGALQIPACSILIVVATVTGYSGSDIASLRFNADSTIANYGSTWKTQTNAAPPVNAQVANNGSLGHITLGSAGITTGRIVTVTITNLSGLRKFMHMESAIESTTTTEGTADIKGWGEYTVTAGQITSIEMRTSGGANTLNAGSGFIVYGDTY